MKLNRVFGVLSAVIFGVPVLIGTAYAGDQYQSSIVEAPAEMDDLTPVNTSIFHLPKPGNKLVVKPSPTSAPGTAMTAQLILKNVECAPNDDKGVANKCGISQDVTKCTAAGKPHPCCTGPGAGSCDPQHGVVDLSVHQYITTAQSGSADIMHFAGVPITIKKGVATIDASGKNKADGGQMFGGYVVYLLGKKGGFHVSIIRTQGSVPGDCADIPAGPGCLDGVEWAITGMTNGM